MGYKEIYKENYSDKEFDKVVKVVFKNEKDEIKSEDLICWGHTLNEIMANALMYATGYSSKNTNYAEYKAWDEASILKRKIISLTIID